MTKKTPPNETAAPPPAAPYEPTKQEKALLTDLVSRLKPTAKATVRTTNGRTTVVCDHPDDMIGLALLCSTFGTADLYFANLLLRQTAQASVRGGDGAPDPQVLNGTLAAVAGTAPSDETEAMLALQMTATHNAVMETLSLAMCNQSSAENFDRLMNTFTKLSRTYAAQVEALSRYRGKGQQKVVVEHVHVHAGGQAIVGHVAPGGEGVSSKSKEQPHAQGQITHDPVAPMWGPDTAGNAVPVTSRAGTEPMPDARRR